MFGQVPLQGCHVCKKPNIAFSNPLFKFSYYDVHVNTKVASTVSFVCVPWLAHGRTPGWCASGLSRPENDEYYESIVGQLERLVLRLVYNLSLPQVLTGDVLVASSTFLPTSPPCLFVFVW